MNIENKENQMKHIPIEKKTISFYVCTTLVMNQNLHFAETLQKLSYLLIDSYNVTNEI